MRAEPEAWLGRTTRGTSMSGAVVVVASSRWGLRLAHEWSTGVPGPVVLVTAAADLPRCRMADVEVVRGDFTTASRSDAVADELMARFGRIEHLVVCDGPQVAQPLAPTTSVQALSRSVEASAGLVAHATEAVFALVEHMESDATVTVVVGDGARLGREALQAVESDLRRLPEEVNRFVGRAALTDVRLVTAPARARRSEVFSRQRVGRGPVREADAPSAIAVRVGARIRDERMGAGLSQADLADAVGATQGTVSRVERGLLVPDAVFVVNACAVLHVSPDTLLGWSDHA